MVPPEAGAVRSFCLATIAEAFGHGYQPDWHNDLDRLGTDSDDYAPLRVGPSWWRDGEVPSWPAAA